MQIDVVAWGNTIKGLSFKSGKKQGEITAHAFTYSKPIKYKGPRILEIHQTAPTSGNNNSGKVFPENGEALLQSVKPIKGKAITQSPLDKELAKRREKEPTLVALAPLPLNSSRVTILLAPTAQGTYQCYVIDDDPSKLPLGKLRVHNLSPYPIGLNFVGHQKKGLMPNKSALVDIKNGRVVYQLSYLHKKKWIIQESNITSVPQDEQIQLIILQNRNQHFLSSDGSSGGFLQKVRLRRKKEKE